VTGRAKDKAGKNRIKDFTRRDFLMGGGAVLVADSLAHAAAPPQAKASYAPSQGYLVYDSRKCAGCVTCMLSCSLVHEGKENLSLARIQIAQNSFARFPDDIRMAVCRQCVTPLCVQNCPTGAAFVDGANGNVRRIDPGKCIGCKTCIQSCPHQPNRTVWNPSKKKSMKCDLCLDTPYWNEKGGPFGKQACVESCPMKAIRLVAEVPDQTETDGYDVNLRNQHWQNLGLVESMETVPPLYKGTPPPPRGGKKSG
jgi:protein NrfC